MQGWLEIVLKFKEHRSKIEETIALATFWASRRDAPETFRDTSMLICEHLTGMVSPMWFP